MQLKLFNLDLSLRQTKEKARRRKLQRQVNNIGLQLTIQFTNRREIAKLLSDRKLNHELMNYAQSLTRDTDNAMDLFQDTMEKALVNSDKFKGGNFKGWLVTIMQNHFKNNVTTKRVIEYREELPQYGFTDTETEVSIREADRYLNILPAQQRRIVEMRMEGYSSLAIAKELGIQPDRVNNQNATARKNLKKIIKKTGLLYK